MSGASTFVLEIVVKEPVPGVAVAIQRGRGSAATNACQQMSTESDLRFSLELVPGESKSGDLKFRSEFVQEDSKGQFIYLRWGQSAGAWGTDIQRRTKIYLGAVTPDLVGRSQQTQTPIVLAIHGKARDGGPACATVPVTVQGPG